MEVPFTNGGIQGISCGTGSTLHVNRAGKDASNMSDHSSGRDLGRFEDLLTPPATASSLLEFVENVTESDRPDEASSLANEMRGFMNAIGFVTLSGMQEADDFGGEAARTRFYAANLRRSDACGRRALSK